MADRDPLALAERYGPYALLLLVAAFMLWVRLIPADRVITDSAVFFSGNDPWYHNRMVHLAVRHFPETTPFDPWSYFPYGTGHHSGFGGLFDQLIALAALIVGFGSPSEHTVDVVTALAPPAFGALTAVPTFVIARRLTDRWGGLIAAVLLALSGGGILARTVVGAADHQSAEALFGAIAVVGFAYSITVAYRESPMLEDILDRNWSYLRSTLLAGFVGGVAVAAYLSLWSPGVMLVFTFGIFVLVQIAREHRAGRPTDHVAIGTVTTMVTAGLLTLLYARSYTISSTEFSLLQPLVSFGLALGTGVLFWLSRYAEREGYDRRHYPPAVVALIIGTLLVAWVVYPRAIDMLRQLFVRVYSFGFFTTVTAGTVVEIQPPSLAQAFNAYGMVLLLGLLGAGLLAYRVWTRNRPVDLLIFLWGFSMFAAYFTMARFGYYFSVVVAILAGFGVWWAAREWLGLDLGRDDLRNLREIDVGMYQVLGILVILLLIVPGNVVAIGGLAPTWERADSPALSGTDQAWYDGLSWMEENTPPVPMGYYDQYDQPADRDVAYPAEAYGVMSWWDYGHWITVIGERIPFANPFQEGAVQASAYLQATNETRANLLMDALSSSNAEPTAIAEMSTDELESVVADQSGQATQEDGRYVAIDAQMAGGKFFAITQWTGPGTNAYFQSQTYQLQEQRPSLPTTSQRYEETMLARLYFQDASTLEHYRLVHEDDRYAIVGGYFDGRSARALTSLRVGQGWDSVASIANQLEQSRRAGRMVSLGQGSSQYVYNARVESRVKLYERVEGATLTGTVPGVTNATPVAAYVRLQTDTGRNFTYVQQTQTDADGDFSITVPYATDDGVTLDEGGTDSSVSARSDFQIQAGAGLRPLATGSTAVPEEAVYDGREIRVELEPVETGNATSDSASSTDTSDGLSATARPPA